MENSFDNAHYQWVGEAILKANEHIPEDHYITYRNGRFIYLEPKRIPTPYDFKDPEALLKFVKTEKN